MDTNIVPVQETEMREFFNRLATTFVGLASQANELKKVQEQVSAMQGQIATMQGEATGLRNELQGAWDFAHGLEERAKTAEGTVENLRKALENVQAEARHWHDENEKGWAKVRELEPALQKANERVASLEDTVSRQVDSLNATTSELNLAHDALFRSRRESDDWQSKANSFEVQLGNVKANEQYLRDEGDKLRATIADVRGEAKKAQDEALHWRGEYSILREQLEAAVKATTEAQQRLQDIMGAMQSQLQAVQAIGSQFVSPDTQQPPQAIGFAAE